MASIAHEKGEKSGIIANLVLPTQRRTHATRLLSKREADVTQNDWNEMKNHIFHHLLENELRVDIDDEDLSVLITEHIFTDRATRAEAARRLFEDYKFKAVMFAPQEYLSLIGRARKNGIVVNVGHTYSSVVPIWNDFNVLRDKAVVCPVGGQDVTQALELLLNQNRNHYNVFPYYKNRKMNKDCRVLDPNRILVEHIKEKLAYVVEDYENELSKSEVLYDWELPDGSVVKLGRELYQCTECLFNPELFGIENTPGLISAINHVTDSLKEPIRTDLVKSAMPVIITGSCSMLPGLIKRVTVGVKRRYPDIEVIAKDEREILAWIGGYRLAEFGRHFFTTVEEYRAHGPIAVHNKCF